MKKQYLFLILIYSVVVLVGVTLKHLHHFAVNRDSEFAHFALYSLGHCQ